ncbi:aldose epimerase family protein [Oceanobacillus profundus]|uniref:Aldose 1-epimerase n=1 Tax=Oceanobacillus profundus TaxID=372463 RepID=A0A417YCA8_9BACI|nr:aldose epimerase family protein [Oceanobacillus profundus]MDO6451572.1 aldose epimerase family protein [Oceanobacillus profundus]PAE30319.1 galactose-1-epimerase [Paenibacillus sp. 7884-2]RHW30330.1 galactose mutarotase [Oceanobacillus profundus]
MKVETTDILGKWKEYTLVNEQGMSVSVINFGGIITEMLVPNRNGKLENVVIGFKNYADYETNPNYFGALIGRVAGRIQGGEFVLNGKTYSLDHNDGDNHLHGGASGFHQVIWNVDPFQTSDTVGLKLTHKSLDGDGGYPGNLDVTVTYILNNDNQFTIDYAATSDQVTPITLTNHSYFNLSGDLKNTIHHHHITIDSEEIVKLDEKLIPTGKLMNVFNTSFDFRESRSLREGFNDKSEQNTVAGNGYDHYFIFNKKKENAVTVSDEKSGRLLMIKTDQPGMVMYTSNMLEDGMELKEGFSEKYLGVCFETQASPASLHYPGFPSVILKAGEQYKKQTVFSFSIVR